MVQGFAVLPNDKVHVGKVPPLAVSPRLAAFPRKKLTRRLMSPKHDIRSRKRNDTWIDVLVGSLLEAPPHPLTQLSERIGFPNVRTTTTASTKK